MDHSLFSFGGLLGQRDAKTTQHYAHLQDHPIHAAANRMLQRVPVPLSGRARIL